MSSLVSIIIPCYNALPFLKETLESAINQTYQNIEIIVIDDGSTDGSYQYLQDLKVPNLTLAKNKGKGACAARNYGIELSKGDYIQFLDADDLLSPTKIEDQVELLQKSPNRIAVCSTVHFYTDPNKGKVVDKDFLYDTDKPHQFLLKLYGGDGKNHSMVAQHAWLSPRKIISESGEWNETLLKDQDGEYFCRVVMASEGICYSEKPKNYYRKHKQGSNIANKKERQHLESQLKALKSKFNTLSDHSTSIAFKRAFALQYRLLAIDAFPRFKDISFECIQKSRKLGESNFTPVLGGRIVELLKSIFGWRVAKSFTYWIHRFK